MTEPSKTEQDFSPVEQKLRGKIAELFEDARQEGVILKWADGFTDAGQVLDLIRETFSELAKERGYVLLGKYDLLVGKPITGLPQVGNFLPEEYQPILGDIPPEPWELTGYSGDRYLTTQGRQIILEDIQRSRKARADWNALSPEDRARLEQEQKDRETEE